VASSSGTLETRIKQTKQTNKEERIHHTLDSPLWTQMPWIQLHQQLKKPPLKKKSINTERKAAALNAASKATWQGPAQTRKPKYALSMLMLPPAL